MNIYIKKKKKGGTEGRKGGRERKDDTSHSHALVSAGASDVIVGDVLCNTE